MPDPFSLFCILSAAAILGVAKGGFGGVGAPVALPIMSLALPTDLALGILLPLLMSGDAVSVTAHRKHADWRVIGYALPGAVAGVALGVWVITLVTTEAITAAVGVIAVGFAVLALSGFAPQTGHWPRWTASLFGGASSLTSTLAHAGGPLIHIYLLSRSANQLVFVATSGIFMASVNIIKLGPYFAIGALNKTALMWALALAPVAIGAAFFGVYLARVLSKTQFKYGVNGLMLVVGLKLIFDAFL